MSVTSRFKLSFILIFIKSTVCTHIGPSLLSDARTP